MLLRASFNVVAVDDVTKNCDVLIEVWSGSGHTETNTNSDLSVLKQRFYQHVITRLAVNFIS